MSEAEALQEVTLSREELLLLLHLVKAEGLPGLDPDPLGDLDEKENARRLIYAERALRARGLARIDGGGRLQLREELLVMTSVCAFPQQTLVVRHFPSPDQGVRLFGHVRVGVVVGHTRPEAPLHHFEIYQSSESLVMDAFALCRLPLDGAAPQDLPALPVRLVAGMRQARQEGKLAGYMAGLEGERPQAEPLAAVLEQEYAVSIMNGYRLLFDGQIASQQVTLLHTTGEAWMVTESGTSEHETAGEGLVYFHPVRPADLFEMLAGWLVVPDPA